MPALKKIVEQMFDVATMLYALCSYVYIHTQGLLQHDWFVEYLFHVMLMLMLMSMSDIEMFNPKKSLLTQIIVTKCLINFERESSGHKSSSMQ